MGAAFGRPHPYIYDDLVVDVCEFRELCVKPLLAHAPPAAHEPPAFARARARMGGRRGNVARAWVGV